MAEEFKDYARRVFARKYDFDNIETYFSVTPEMLDEYRAVTRSWAEKFGIELADFSTRNEPNESGCIIHSTEGTDTVTAGGGFDQKSDRTIDDVITDDCH